MIWSASVDLTVSIDIDDIEADTRREAEQIAFRTAKERVKNCEYDTIQDDALVIVWKGEDDEQQHKLAYDSASE